MAVDRARLRRHVQNFAFRELFVDELGWNRHRLPLTVTVDGASYSLSRVAEKRGFQVFECGSEPDGAIPDHARRMKIYREAAKSALEHLVIFVDAARNCQTWQWVRREPGKPLALRSETYTRGQSGERLVQKLTGLAVALEEEETIGIADVAGRVRQAFDVDRVTKRFYDRFKSEHARFLAFVKGIQEQGNREWYASLMLNRLMFVYFIQKKGFLDGDGDYLRNRLRAMQARRGKDQFLSFYRHFLLRLFHEGLGRPESARAADLDTLIGQVPYLNGGLFDVHELERANPKIEISDEAFERIFVFFDGWQWHLDERPLRADNEINPDVLGYIFEKYINQKQMGAYYTKEDITGYIGKNTIIPYLFDAAEQQCRIAFRPDGALWGLLRENPDRYIYEAIRMGVDRALPADVTAGLADVSQRGGWNRPADPDYALPTETWREHVARRRRYEEVWDKLVDGEVHSIDDLITYNLDVRQFAQDVIQTCEGPELLRAFYRVIEQITVLDPTCGSGAFLFAALSILEPLYEACLERMQAFLDDLDRSGEQHRPEKFSDFRKVLERVAQHPNHRYFILKSIIIGNLYGVDIMEEAVEICKLRLFLKLVAQVDRADEIEPLPDIDFNIRAGNTLVGFATYEEVRRAVQGEVQTKMDLGGDMERIDERADIADRAYRRFREMQTEHRMNAEAFRGAKIELRDRLDGLREELDCYLAEQCGIPAGRKAGLEQWRTTHQPFHWFVEFYSILKAGGFDAVIGNPPYLELAVLGEYRPRGYDCESAGNLYALVLERCFRLCSPDGRQGFIVPVSSISTDRYEPLQRLLATRSLHYSSFDDRPSRLFVGLEHIRLTIHLIGSLNQEPRVFSTRYNKWNAYERVLLFDALVYASASPSVVKHSLPKLSHRLEYGILDRLSKQERSLSSFYSRGGNHDIFYSRKLGYFVQALDFEPTVLNGEGLRRPPSEFKKLTFDSAASSMSALCLLNSSLFYWFLTVFSDCRSVNKREIDSLPVQLGALSSGNIGSGILALTKRLVYELDRTSEIKKMIFSHDTLTVQCIFPKRAKAVIDDIDRAITTHYGFTDEEVDYIINYDIKYRMGRGADTK
jgi:hypothetical protein